MQDKIIYEDGDKQRILQGKIVDEDDSFVSIQLEDSVWKINKKKVLSMRRVESGSDGR